MNSELLPFTFEGATLRTILIDGEPWFVAADVCRMIDLRDVTSAVGRVDAEDRLMLRRSDTPHLFGGIAPQVQYLTVVNESGLYALVFQSNKPEARRFRRWVTAEVLPSVRKTGGAYIAPGSAAALDLLNPDTALDKLIEVAQVAKAERAARLLAEQRVEELIDPAMAWLGLEDADGDYEVADAAKILSRDPRIIIGEIRLFQFMAEQRWVFRNEHTDRWKAYQSQVDCGRLAEKPGGIYKHPKTKRKVKGDPTVRVTAKGLAELYKRLTVGTQLELISGGAE